MTVMTIETVDPREMGMSPGISCWQKERTPAGGGGGTCLPERFLRVPKNSSDLPWDETEALAVMGQ